MIKHSGGITLLSLVMTIIILLILAGVGINFSYKGMEKIQNNQLQIELGIVRQAITEQYTKASAVNQTKILVSKPKVSFWVGEPIIDVTTIALPEKETVFHQKLKNYTYQYQEDYYYRLCPEDLDKLGVTDATDSYIVNYKTGEVYNEAKKLDSNSEILYLPQTTYHNSQIPDGEDTQSFNDW